ncbi:lipocalin family protein [uncultured Polaribacter sp.]|uniref:lipocalin family protein n=1 Tax=uncultured Polaribacter sp. TaxID=174711 RepID=UPI00263A1303|nr:lipocalin family protein [uncultured Polaribacter sp.]
MKKILVLLCIATLFSCGANKNLKIKEKTLKGNWVLNKIVYSKTGNYNVTIFNDTTKDCLEGSTWKFVPNNNTGIYTINNTDCNSGEREFIFVVQEVDKISGYFDFLLKPKNNKDNIGYRLDLTELSENTMQCKQRLSINGVPFIINMNFTKQ